MKVCAQLRQRLYKVSDWSFSHPSVAIQSVFAVSEGEKCGEKSCGGACVADEEFGFACRDFSTQPCDGHLMVGFVELDIETEGLQGFGEAARVVGEEGVGETSSPFGEGGDEQGAVGQ